VVFVTILVVGGGFLELSVFRFVDHSVCSAVRQPQPDVVTLAAARVQFLPSSQLIVRAVYLDPRPRNGFLNVSVFLAEIHKELIASRGIVACGIGSGVSTTLEVRVVKNSHYLHDDHPELSHDVAMVDCFGLPNTPSGSRAFLWYQHSVGGGDTQHRLNRVESEQRYFVPPPKQTRNDDDLRVVVCMGTIRDVPPYMNDFIRYYKHLGVDHIYMTGEESFFRSGVLQNDEFVPTLHLDLGPFYGTNTV
jgi:hypothetical protein